MLSTVRAAPRLVAAAVARYRAASQYDGTLVVALDAIGRGVRSGASLPQAVSEAATSVRGPVAADLTLVVTSVGRGQPFADALGDWRAARTRPSVRLTVGALVLASTTGGPPARVIEEVASAIRTRQQVAREAQALAAQARLSALVVGVAPVGFMVVMCATDPRNAHLMFGTRIGLACVALGITLDAAGAMWMHRMSARVTL
jgi:tight adherence protein B